MALLRGTNRNDVLKGSASRDYILGLLGADRIDGDLGNDTIYAGGGADTVRGGGGDDYVNGAAGMDSIYGGDGNDRLEGGDKDEKDLIYGEEGNDIIVAYRNDVAFGGSGEDTLYIFKDFGSATEIFEVDLSEIGGASLAATGFEGIRAGQIERSELNLYNCGDGSIIVGSVGNDRISAAVPYYGVPRDIFIEAGAGHDYIQANGTGSSVRGGAGDDILSAGGIGMRLYGGTGDDLFQMATTSGNPANVIMDFRDGDLIHHPVMSSAWPEPDRLNPLRSGSNPTATSTKGQWLYDTDDGRLFYDPDGRGALSALHAFTLKGKPHLDASDFAFL